MKGRLFFSLLLVVVANRPLPTFACATTFCSQTVAAATAVCTQTAIAGAALGLIQSFDRSTSNGDTRGACRASIGLNELASGVNAAFAARCGLAANAARAACSAAKTSNEVNLGLCRAQQGGTCPCEPEYLAAITENSGGIGTSWMYIGLAGLSGAQSASNLLAFGRSQTCERELRNRNNCDSIADFDSKPECRFELCPNVTSVPGLTPDQVRARIDQALAEVRSRAPASQALSAADRERICSVAALNCQNPELRNDPVCRCEREPTGSGCRNVASVTTTTRPGDGGGSPTGGGPPNGGGTPTGGGPNNNLPGSFTGGDGPPFGEGPGFNGGRGNNSNNDGLRMNVGNGSGGSGAGGGSAGGGSGSSALGGGSSGGGMSEGGSGGSNTGGAGSQAAAASEGAGFSAGAFGDGGEDGGSGSAGRGFNPNMSFGGAGGYRKPGAAGLSVNHGQDRIGVSGENMFLMIERQYKRQRSLGTLLTEGR